LPLPFPAIIVALCEEKRPFLKEFRASLNTKAAHKILGVGWGKNFFNSLQVSGYIFIRIFIGEKP